MDRYFNMENFLTVCSYVMWLFLGNLYFWLCNIPLIAYFLIVGIKNIQSSILLFILCLVPIGPSLTALMYSMGKLVRDRNVHITKDYFSSYIKNFMQSLLLWVIQLSLFFMLYINIQYFRKLDYGYILIPFFYAAIILLVLITLYAYPLISRFYMKTIDVIKASFAFTISIPLLTLGNIIIIIFALMLIEIRPSYAVLFINSITCYLIMFFQREHLKKLEEKSKSI